MAIYGYNRTSTDEQHLDRGDKRIRDFCAQQGLDLVEIYSDQQTGKNFNRPEYQFIKKRLRQGDTLIISEVDRLGRNKEGTLQELRDFKERGVRVMILEIPTTLIDLRSMDDSLAGMLMETITNMLIEMYATFAEAEMRKREQRQREGYERLKRNGEWDKLGRPRAVSKEVICRGIRASAQRGDATMRLYEKAWHWRDSVLSVCEGIWEKPGVKETVLLEALITQRLLRLMLTGVDRLMPTPAQSINRYSSIFANGEYLV